MAYSCVTNPNEDLAIQAFVARVSNESMKFAFCGNGVNNMKELIAKTHKLSDIQEMSCGQMPHL